ncbi:hypothetical protein [Actinoplanes sp. HUAS TT8]|uniref:hypothetical protein n=1 Tax=Actinoplanes sp. HUAS TT8 TaxID=3447453 RepID=UPI003F521830
MTLRTVVVALSLLVALGFLRTAIRDAPDELPRLRKHWWMLLLVVIWAGDAAFGEDRPLFERAGKGTLAVLVTTAAVTVFWLRRRSREVAPAD